LRVDAAGGSKSGKCAIEPAAVADRGLGEAAFEQILAVEMRTFAIGRGASVDDDRLLGLEQPMQVGHCRVERKEIAELERRRLAVQRQGLVAAKFGPIRIADGRHRRQSIKRAAQDDREETRIAAFCMR
jgi:hypothetical protein